MKHPVAKKLFLVLFFLAFIGGGVFWFTQRAQGVTRTWDGGGTDGTCGGGAGDGNKWSCAANWSADTVPTASDVATFDGTSTKDATIAANVSVAGVNIASGYTGTITQTSTFTVTVGASHWTQADGTFAGGSGTIDINGAFLLSGGTFTSTSGTLEVGQSTSSSATIFTVSGGTFSHNNGTISFAPIVSGCLTLNFTIDVVTSLTLYDIIINGDKSCGASINSVIAASGDTIIAANNFTITNGFLEGTWQVQGNVVIGSGAGGSGTLTMTGTGNKTYAYTASGVGPHLRVNNTAIAVSALGGTTALKVTAFSLLAGTFTAPSGTMTVGKINAGSETVLTVSGGSFYHNNGTVSFAPIGGSCSASVFTVDVTTSLTLYNIIVNAPKGCGSGDVSLVAASGDTIIAESNLTLSDGILNGTWEVRGNVVSGSGADGGTATVSFTGSNDQIYTDSGGNEPNGDMTINKTGGTVTLASNADWNASNQDLTITSGILSLATYTLATTTVTIAADGTLLNKSTGDLTLGGTLTNSGLVLFGLGVAGCGGADNILIRSSSNGVQRSWNGTGTFTLYDVDVQDMAGSASITAYSSTSTSGNGGNWTFSAGTCPTLPPTMGLSTGKINLQSGKLNLRY